MKLEKTVLDLIVRYDTTNFLCCLCSIFVILNLPKHCMSNMLYQFLHFKGERS